MATVDKTYPRPECPPASPFHQGVADNAIILWNTAYLARAIESLRAEGYELPDDLIRHISPQIREHINLTGIYDWRREPQPKGTFRPLRTAKEKFSAAA